MVIISIGVVVVVIVIFAVVIMRVPRISIFVIAGHRRCYFLLLLILLYGFSLSSLRPLLARGLGLSF